MSWLLTTQLDLLLRPNLLHGSGTTAVELGLARLSAIIALSLHLSLSLTVCIRSRGSANQLEMFAEG